MPYTFGGKLLGLGHLADIATVRTGVIPHRARLGSTLPDFPGNSDSPHLAHHLTVIDVQRSKHVGLASAVGSPSATGTPESASTLNVVTLCDN
jgi:hypothetical protein